MRGVFGVSWGKARGWIESGKVLVGGQTVTEGTARVAAGAEVEVDERARRVRAGGLTDDQVVYVDAQVLVVAKPAGVSTVPYDESETDTLESRARAWLERKSKAGRGARPALGVVHRLDKETSGLVVFTRTWLAKQQLATQFRQHTVHRRYIAIAHGTVVPGTIRSMLIEDRGDRRRGSARGTPPPGAREAVTHVESARELDGATLVTLRLETGRTHQIRIHLSESGHPVVGDRVYTKGYAGPLIEAPRLMLHAAELGFVHPATHRDMRWTQPIPTDMSELIARLGA